MTGEPKVRIGVSTCLMGESVRYDGGHKWDRYLTDTLGRFVEWVPVCPEVECGLPVPREAMHLEARGQEARLVTTKTGVDHTDRMRRWMEKRLRELESENLCGFVFKTRSPSSGLVNIPVYKAAGQAAWRGPGLFAAGFTERFPLVPVEDDGRLHDPELRENFIERVFVYRRWREVAGGGAGVKDLVEFHTRHKLLIMAHSLRHEAALGRIVAGASGRVRSACEEYGRVLMEGLAVAATAKKNTNVLMHMMGYFKKILTADEKQELLEVIERYRTQTVPLVVPMALLSHYVRKYDSTYLKTQWYLNPHPAELMLRNHV